MYLKQHEGLKCTEELFKEFSLKDHLDKLSNFYNFFKIFFSVLPIYVLGLIWLGILIGWDKPIFDLGAKPFLLAEIFKIAILALLVKKIIKIRKFI